MYRPRRKFEITLNLGADSAEDVIVALRELTYEATANHGVLRSVSGGPSAHWSCTTVVDEAMTHERYFELLDEYTRESLGSELGRGG